MRAVKSLVERTLVRSRIGGALGRSDRFHGLVLAYHNIVPVGEAPGGDRSLHLPRRAFAAHLDAIAERHTVVPLSDLLAPPTMPALRPRVAITFDDAYEGALTDGVPELTARGMPATIFVTPAFIGGRSFWWDAVADPASGEVPPAIRHHALEALRGDDEAVRSWARRVGIRVEPQPASARGGSEEALAHASRQPGITMASHSWSHANLRALDAASLARELDQPLRWLRARFSAISPWISYPYGLAPDHIDEPARAAGYTAGLRVEGGWIRGAEGGNAFRMPRLNVPAGLSPAGLKLRLAGLLCR